MMPAKFNLYSAWMDPYFYVWAAVFAAALFILVYSVRRYLELRHAAPAEEEPAVPENPFLEDPLPAPAQEERPLVVEPPAQAAFADETPDAEKTLVVPPPFPQADAAPAEPAELPAQQEELPAPELPAAQPVPEPAPLPSPAAGEDHARAENFVRGIYAGITDLDERMKGIEEALSKGHVNNDFAVKFLEDMLQDMDNLDKAKIKARIEYLLSDLKK